MKARFQWIYWSHFSHSAYCAASEASRTSAWKAELDGDLILNNGERILGNTELQTNYNILSIGVVRKEVDSFSLSMLSIVSLQALLSLGFGEYRSKAASTENLCCRGGELINLNFVRNYC